MPGLENISRRRSYEQGFTFLPVLAEHTHDASLLPLHHLDPFDRLLIAQARINDLSIVTADRAFAQYDVRRTSI